MRPRWILEFALVVACLFSSQPGVCAAVVVSGDCEPADPTTWTDKVKVIIGKTGEGSVAVDGGGTVVTGATSIGDEIGANGALTIDGAGSTWTSHDRFVVGRSGRGTLSVTGGATLIKTDSSNTHSYIGDTVEGNGEVTVQGSGSRWMMSNNLYVGYLGTGSLHILDGAQVVNDPCFACMIGYDGGAGTVRVEGPGSTWSINRFLDVGNGGEATLEITRGATVNSVGAMIGFRDHGEVTIDGSSSRWNCTGQLIVGRRADGDGTLSIGGGASVLVAGYTSVGREDGQGSIKFGSGGGTLTTAALAAAPHQLAGTGTINAKGLVSDVDLVFDSTASLRQTFLFSSAPGECVTVNIDMVGGALDSGVALGAGWDAIGSLAVREGTTVVSQYGVIGHRIASNGTVTVDGSGSQWDTSWMTVAEYGVGTLDIAAGGAVSSQTRAVIGEYRGATGIVNVDGAGSKWTHQAELHVGSSGDGTISITAGGAVSCIQGYIGLNAGSSGVVTVDGADSTWTSSRDLAVGNRGSGTLNIRGAGTVNAARVTLALEPGTSTGAIVFGPGGGTLNSRSLLASAAQLMGVGTVNTQGLVSDVDLVFDSETALSQVCVFDGLPDQRITVNLDLSDPIANGGLGAGFQGNGSLVIRDGVSIASQFGYLGYHAGSTGHASIAGAGTKWTTGSVDVGFAGNGTVDITAGGALQCSSMAIGSRIGSIGVVTIDGDTSTCSATTEARLGFAGHGTLNVRNGGSLSTRAPSIGHSHGSVGVVNVDGPGSTWSITAGLYVGNYGTGTLNVTGGAVVSTNSSCYISNTNDAQPSKVIVAGVESTFTIGDRLYVGLRGSGAMEVMAGATAASESCIIGNSYSSGVVAVDGAGSRWINNTTMQLGFSTGSGTLNIAGGGVVESATVSISSTSLVAIDVGQNSQLVVDSGNGPIANDGVLRIVAGAGPTTGAGYFPVSATTVIGSGAIEAVGGVWDAASRQFTVSGVQVASSDTWVSFDQANAQRLMIHDGATGWSVGGSFLATTQPAPLSVRATIVQGGLQAKLEDRLDVDESMLAGWQFNASNENGPSPWTYLSFDVGEGYSRESLSAWCYVDSTWTRLDAPELTYDGRYASFNGSSSLGYALAAAPVETVVRTWTGSTAGGEWSGDGNWNTNAAFGPTDIVILGGDAGAVSHNDLVDQQIGGLRFAADAAAIHLTGNGLALTGRIDNRATAVQQIDVPLEFLPGSTSGTINVVSDAHLIVSQPISGELGLSKTGLGTLELLQDAAYTGDTIVDSGTLVMRGLDNGGSTTVNGTLIAEYIRQDSLTIGAGGMVELAASGFGLSAASSSTVGTIPVPEPATWLLLTTALLAGLLAWRCRGDSRGARNL